MIEIIENKIFYNGIEYQILLLEEDCVHIINENDGYCILIDNEELKTNLKNIIL